MAILTTTRIRWVSLKYDMWLDFKGVKRKRRRALTAELRANLRVAADDVGGTTEAVSSYLFPFFGSEVTVEAPQNGLAIEVQSGPMPAILGMAGFVALAKPWRLFSRTNNGAVFTR